MKQFQVTLDTSGNILCSGGYVIDLVASTTTATLVGGTPIPGTFAVNGIRQATFPNTVFMGGSGAELLAYSDPAFAPSDRSMLGHYQKLGYLDYAKNGFKIIYSISEETLRLVRADDESYVVADQYPYYLPFGGGILNSNAQSEIDYNGGNFFQIDLDTSQPLQESVATVPTGIGTLQGGAYTLSDFQKWTSDTDADFVIETASDGSATLSDATDIIAERSPADPQTAAGTYLSTTYGATTYNNTIPFVAEVTATQAFPREGYVYVELTFSAGAFSSASELFFAATLPANTTNVKVMPIAYSDGNGSVFQIQEGPIFIR